MNSKSKFQKKILSPQNDYWKKFLRNPLGQKTLDSKTDQFVGKNFISKFDFFQKIPFQTLIFNEKACFKIMPFKISTQSEKLVIVRGANRVKTLFLRPDVFIEIWFLNIFWTQNLIFRKILSPQNHFSNIILSKSARTKNSRFKNWSICRKKLHFKIRHFFQKIPFQISDFQRKGLLQNHAFWNRHEKWKLCCFSRSNLSQNVFFLMWFFDRNLISQ